ncbi:MAG: SLC13 family permease [Alphaproteobacteria bacterium]
MTIEQIAVALILLGALVGFMWGRVRYDIVALAALLAAVFAGVVPTAEAFSGFGHPAVITVACVLVISRALQASGFVDHIADWLARKVAGETGRRAALCTLGAALSGFMNNVGALALLLPVAVRTTTRPAAMLMPLSFATILGGMVTLIGTPPNIVVANARRLTGEGPFAMFDFAFVGLPLAIVGLAFVVLIGWRLIPNDRQGRRSAEDLFEINTYIAETRVKEDAACAGKTVRALEGMAEGAVVAGIVRDGTRRLFNLWLEILRPGDIVLLRADPAVLDRLVSAAGLEIVTDLELTDETLRSDDVSVTEAVIQPGSRLEGRRVYSVPFRRRYGVALLALARSGEALGERIAQARLTAGDVLLLQGDSDGLADAVAELGCLPLAQRGLSIGRPRRALLAVGLFAVAIIATVVGVLPAYIAFAAAVLALIALNVVGTREAYEAVDWPILVLLGALIPVGNALQTTGTAGLVADIVAAFAGAVPAIVLVGLVLVVTMTLSDVMNNAATAVVMSPIAIGIAERLSLNPEPFLMAVAIGASCAFLTPIGHQNNVLVMGPGGYRFSDYWRMGLPLEILIVLVSLPLIAVFWPLAA